MRQSKYGKKKKCLHLVHFSDLLGRCIILQAVYYKKIFSVANHIVVVSSVELLKQKHLLKRQAVTKNFH